jgi:hypothetical protein
MKKLIIISLSLLLCFQASAHIFLKEEGNKHERLNTKIEMKKYEVIALSVGGLSNKIFNSKEIVSEDAFEKGRADELVQKGFLKEIDLSEEASFDTDSNDGLNDSNLQEIPLDNRIDDGLNPDHPQEFDTTQPEEINPELNSVSTEAVDATQPVVENQIDSIPDIDKITKNEIIKGLKEKGIDYDVNSTKQDLYNLLYNKN